MVSFGADTWQRSGDVFVVYFATPGRLAPLAPGSDGRGLVLRPPGRHLVAPAPVPTGLVGFVIAMLATVLFDGLLGTRMWRALDRALSTGPDRVMDGEGYLLATAGLLAVWLVLLGAYVATAWLTAHLVGAGFDGRHRAPPGAEPGPHRDRLQFRPQHLLPALAGAGADPPTLRPLRARLGSLRHRELEP